MFFSEETKPKQLSPTVSVVAPDGRKVECSLGASKRGIRIDLKDDVSIGAGQSLTATLAGSGNAA